MGIGLTFPFISYGDILLMSVSEVLLWNFKAIEHNEKIEAERNKNNQK